MASRRLTAFGRYARAMANGDEVSVPTRHLEGATHRPEIQRTTLVAATPEERVLWAQIADEIEAFECREALEDVPTSSQEPLL